VREVWLSTAAFADREYLIYEDERVTYGQAHAIVGAVAAWLARQGVRQATGWRSPCGTTPSGC
jgi:long-chain acyl-CoA synthetase